MRASLQFVSKFVGKTIYPRLKYTKTMHLLPSVSYTVELVKLNQTSIRRCTSVVPELPQEPVVPPPYTSESDRQYTPKIQRIVDDISKLTLLEVADLNDLLKKTLNIKDAPVMAMGTAPVAAADQDSEEAMPMKQKTSFVIKLMNFNPEKKVPLIKEIRNLMDGLNLVQAKKFVETLPQIVRTDVGKDEAESLKATLEAVGGTVEID